MNFLVGIETPEHDHDSYRALVPLFIDSGVSCDSTAITQDQVMSKIKYAIERACLEVIEQGEELSQLSAADDFLAIYSNCTQWLTLEVKV